MSEHLNNVSSQTDPTELANPTLAFLRRYWDEKRGDRLMPSRRDIRPSELKEHLGWVLMIEVFPDLSDFRYKLIGTLVTQYFLSDATGQTVSEAFARYGPVAIKAVQALLRKTARDRIPMRAYGNAGWIAPGFEQFDALYLPLSDDGETVNMILHGFVFDRPTVLMAREIARARWTASGHAGDVRRTRQGLSASSRPQGLPRPLPSASSSRGRTGPWPNRLKTLKDRRRRNASALW